MKLSHDLQGKGANKEQRYLTTHETLVTLIMLYSLR